MKIQPLRYAKIPADTRKVKFYGFVLGTLALVFTFVKATAYSRATLRFKSTFVLHKPWKAYGIITGPAFYGYTNLPKWSKQERLDALCRATMQDPKWAFAAVKEDIDANHFVRLLNLPESRFQSSEVDEKIDAILSGKEVLPAFETDAERYAALVARQKAGFTPVNLANTEQFSALVNALRERAAREPVDHSKSTEKAVAALKAERASRSHTEVRNRRLKNTLSLAEDHLADLETDLEIRKETVETLRKQLNISS